jgi:hypothetical protein
MEEFQEILLVSIQHRLYITQKAAKRKKETQSMGFFEKTTRFLRNSTRFFQKAIEYILQEKCGRISEQNSKSSIWFTFMKIAAIGFERKNKPIFLG